MDTVWGGGREEEKEGRIEGGREGERSEGEGGRYGVRDGEGGMENKDS